MICGLYHPGSTKFKETFLGSHVVDQVNSLLNDLDLFIILFLFCWARYSICISGGRQMPGLEIMTATLHFPEGLAQHENADLLL